MYDPTIVIVVLQVKLDHVLHMNDVMIFFPIPEILEQHIVICQLIIGISPADEFMKFCTEKDNDDQQIQ
jgi:hypothetical protein